MKVTIELIDELRGRVNCTYDEAKKTLEKNDGDLIKSIIELEEKKGAKACGTVKKNNDGFSDFIDKFLQLRFSVKNKEGDTLVNIPLVLVLLTFLLAFWVVIFLLAVAIVSSCNIKIYKAKKFTNVNDIKDNFKSTVNKVKTSTEKMFEDDEEIVINKSKKDDDNEITIE